MASSVPIPVPRAHDRLDALTSVRFFAALHVVFYHYASPVFQRMPAVLQGVEIGYYAVSVFYVLSGFVLVYSYSGARGEFRGTRRNFWVGRFARVYPAYALAFLLCIPEVASTLLRSGQAAQTGKASIAAVGYLGMVQAWVPRLSVWWNYPGWSVSVEAFFYLCFPFLLPWVGKFGKRACYGAIAASWLVSAAIYAGLYLTIPNLDASPALKNGFGFNPLLRVPTFLTGMAVGRLFFLNRERRGSPVWALVAVVLCVAAMGASVLLPQRTLRDTVLGPVFALLIYSLAVDRSWVSRALGLGPLVLLGDASYGVYILQWPVYFLCGLSAASMNAWKFTAFVCVLLIVSIASFRYLEEPLRRAIRARLA